MLLANAILTNHVHFIHYHCSLPCMAVWLSVSLIQILTCCVSYADSYTHRACSKESQADGALQMSAFLKILPLNIVWCAQRSVALN